MEILDKRLTFNELADLEVQGEEIPEEYEDQAKKVKGMFDNINRELDKQQPSVYEMLSEYMKVLEPFMKEDGKLDKALLQPFLNADGSLNDKMLNDFKDNTTVGINLDDIYHIKDNNARKFFHGKVPGETLNAMNLIPSDKKADIELIVRYPLMDNLKLSQSDFNVFDWMVYNSICSLLEKGKKKINTIDTIYRNMIGNPNAKCSEAMHKRVLDSIIKLSNTELTIIDRHVVKKYYNGAELEITEKLLSVKRYTLRIGGFSVTAIELLTSPILYVYASKIQQVAKVPSKILNAGVRNSESNIMLKTLLIDHVEWLNGSKKNSKKPNPKKPNPMLFKTIYENLGLETVSAQRNIRNITEKILKYWKEIGYIQNYDFIKDKNTLKSIKIDV